MGYKELQLSQKTRTRQQSPLYFCVSMKFKPCPKNEAGYAPGFPNCLIKAE